MCILIYWIFFLVIDILLDYHELFLNKLIYIVLVFVYKVEIVRKYLLLIFVVLDAWRGNNLPCVLYENITLVLAITCNIKFNKIVFVIILCKN